MNETQKAALELITKRKWNPIPVPHGSKKLKRDGWQTWRVDENNVGEYFNGQPANIGVHWGEKSGDAVDTDLDCPEAVALASMFLPATDCRFGLNGEDRHYVYQATEPLSTQKFKDTDGSMLVEIRSTGSYTIVPPSTHPEGGSIKWAAGGKPATIEGDALIRAVELLAAAAILSRHWPEKGGRHDAALALSGGLLRAGWPVEKVEHFVRAVCRAAGDYEVDDRLAAVRSTAAKIEHGENVVGWRTFADCVGDKVASRARDWLKLPAPTDSSDGEHTTDLGNARRLVTQHGRDLRHCGRLGGWFVWDGRRWVLDETAEVERRAQSTVLTIYDEARRESDSARRDRLARWALQSEALNKRRAMIDSAASQIEVVAAPDEFDGNGWLLNVANGTLDLRTGELREHQREDLITKLAPVAYDPAATCPRFEAFLDRIFAGDAELIAFMRRAIGYALTGDTREDAFFIFFGTGANGKSTFLQVIRSVLGDYARHAPASTFLTSGGGDRIRNDLAALRGSRFVSAVEVGDGRQLDEPLVKELTGGEPLTTRFLHREFFTYQPEFKVVLAVNHRPIIRGQDRGIWRRIRLVPFTVEIPESEWDRTLAETLVAGEGAGILAWAVRGCLEWQRDGLGHADAVERASSEFKNDSDPLAGFLADACELDLDYPSPEHARLKTPSGALRSEYEIWCATVGEQPMSAQKFGRALTERRIAPGQDRSTGERYRAGVRLKSAPARMREVHRAN